MKKLLIAAAIAATTAATTASAWWDDGNSNTNWNGAGYNNMYNNGYGNAYGNGWGDGSGDASAVFSVSAPTGLCPRTQAAGDAPAGGRHADAHNAGSFRRLNI